MLNFFQATIKNTDSLAHTLKKLTISDDLYSGEDLSNENEFLEKSKKKRKKEEVVTSSKCSFYFGKRIMTLSVELATTPTEEIDIIKNIF